MSEYQYYEFLAVDRPLTQKQIRQVREFSTRAEITSTSFVNEYHWGNFRGDPDQFVTRYFDLMVYFANWGTRRLLMGLPAEAIDVPAWREYERECGFEIRKKSSERVLVEFWSDDEDFDDYGESQGLMASLAPIREELLGGDTRPLYLGWLAGVQLDDEEGTSPPIPPQLTNLTAAQQRLAEFLRVDEDLLEVAARQSAQAAAPSIRFDEWLRGLPPARKDEALLALASGQDPSARAKLIREYQSAVRAGAPPKEGEAPPLERLLEAARQIRDERKAAERARAERRRAKKLAEEAAAREKQIQLLMSREADAWRKVESIVGSKQAKEYDAAVATLRDLREVAIRKEALDAFGERVRALREAHRAKYTFVQRLDQADLLRGR